MSFFCWLTLVEDMGRNLHQILKVTTELAQADSSQVKRENNRTVRREKIDIGIKIILSLWMIFISFKVQFSFFFAIFIFPFFSPPSSGVDVFSDANIFL